MNYIHFLQHTSFQDGAASRPTYNLRTLSRSLEYTQKSAEHYGLRRSLIDGIAMSFQTQLDSKSSRALDNLLIEYFLDPGMTIQVSF